MDKIYMIKSHFEDYDSSYWKIIGCFSNQKLANEIVKKWEDFYLEKQKIFEEPKNWEPTTDDVAWSDGEWRGSLEYNDRCNKYSEIKDFKEITCDVYEINQDRTILSDQHPFESRNEHLLSLMTQWDRNHKLEKLV